MKVKVVPCEPLPEMVGAFWRQKNTGSQEPGRISFDYRDDYSAYRAMLSASPDTGYVAVRREDAHKIERMLDYYFTKHPTDDDERQALDRLRAAMEGGG